MSRAMLLAELLPDVAGIPAELVITGLVQDSRALRPGDAFVAVLPARQEVPSTHGLNFAAQARAAGASAILFEPPAPANIAVPADAIAVPDLVSRMGDMADRFHGEPSRAMHVVGVTGTNGKTSTTQLLAQAWTLQGRRAGTIGTLGAGPYGHPVPNGFTTPLVLQLHALLAELRDAGIESVAMEVSSHALDQGRTDRVRFEVAAFTNLTRDHLDYHGDMDAYASAKAKLFAWPGLRAAVLNLDDAFGRELFASLPPSVRGVGVSAAGRGDADIRAERLKLDGNGIGFDLVVGDTRHAVTSPLLGRFNADNLLAVAGVLHALGAESPAIASLLSQLQPIHGRMNRLGGSGRPVVVVDYAHTPDALEQALSSLREHAHGRLLCVFGCGGERDAGKRPQMAGIAERLADGVIVTDDNPRGEDGDAIVADILRGFADASRVIVERDRARAIGLAIDAANAEDIVLVAGKGHEPYQDIAGVRHPFDDTEVAKAALERRA
jgi:UDP-N-acetylmuramoyl-L-alanyl-D-glutamate--2,6-diaminopimelate ligase